MRCAGEAVIAPAAQQVPHIDHQRVRQGRGGDPFTRAALAHLQAAAVILPEQGNAAEISMRCDAEALMVIGRLRRVENRLGALQRQGVMRREKILRQVQAQRHRLQQICAAARHGGEIGLHGRAQFWHCRRPLIGAAQLLAGQHGGMILWQVQADGEEFLKVRLGCALHHRTAGGMPATMDEIGAAALLHLRRLVEEALGRRHRQRDHLRRHAMPAQVEKTRPCAGRPDLCRQGGQIRPGHIDHRQGFLDGREWHDASFDYTIQPMHMSWQVNRQIDMIRIDIRRAR